MNGIKAWFLQESLLVERFERSFWFFAVIGNFYAGRWKCIREEVRLERASLFSCTTDQKRLLECIIIYIILSFVETLNNWIIESSRVLWWLSNNAGISCETGKLQLVSNYGKIILNRGFWKRQKLQRESKTHREVDIKKPWWTRFPQNGDTKTYFKRGAYTIH